MLFGAAIANMVSNTPLAILLALLSHYFLDLFPHIEYNIPNIKQKNWPNSIPDFLKVTLDFSLGLLIIFIFSNNQPLIYLAACIAIIPDGLTIITSIFPTFLATHHKIHTQDIHYLTKKKKISNFWRIYTQAMAIVASMIMLAI